MLELDETQLDKSVQLDTSNNLVDNGKKEMLELDETYSTSIEINGNSIALGKFFAN